MPIVRKTRNDLDPAVMEQALTKARARAEEEIEADAIEDGGAWTDEDFANALITYPPPKPEEVRALRMRFGLSQAEFAFRFGLSLDALQQYEQGRRVPSRQACTLLRVIEAEPEAVRRALRTPRRVLVPGD